MVITSCIFAELLGFFIILTHSYLRCEEVGSYCNHKFKGLSQDG